MTVAELIQKLLVMQRDLPVYLFPYDDAKASEVYAGSAGPINDPIPCVWIE